MAGPALRKPAQNVELHSRSCHRRAGRLALEIRHAKELGVHPGETSGLHDAGANPPSSLDSIHPELATILLREDGTLAMDTTPESVRNYLGMAAHAEVETTVLGLCAVDLDEWPILRETGALVFAADTAPY